MFSPMKTNPASVGSGECSTARDIGQAAQSEPGDMATPSAQAAVKQINRLAEQGTPVGRLRPCSF